ncbi:unnamed protein product [Adineta steineri]|uniref:TBC1 domain family member 15 n=1 Tax=Adineta steineri TaxID=433720 RepID=A0A814GD09_9BILA|nr:unnamed protein product [Adineta steineri]CAF0993681.1 unnamed protein product [Adineta steineri]CAF1062673.1 unnamed protein product [Adineta steineri]CAF3744993.1 unnamed protein product [Adineta steineri]
MARDKILFERTHVFVKDRISQNDFRSDSFEEINGTLSITENERGRFFRFIPKGTEDNTTDDWALVNGGNSIISFKNTKNDKDSISVTPNPLLKFRFYFNINTLRSIRRHYVLHSISDIVLVLQDGTTLPAFHFTLSGSKDLIQMLGRYLQLEKSPQDNRLYIVKGEIEQENISQPISAFDQMNLFDNSNDLMKRIKGSDSRRTAIEKFSRVTHFFKDALLGQNEFIPASGNPDGTLEPDITAIMESFNGDLRESNNDGFEVIYKVDFKKLPEVTRYSPMTIKEWEMSLDKDGRVIDINKMKERIFRGGLESNKLRSEVWKFLLNYYPWTSTLNERIELSKQKESEYFAMKLQWKSMIEQQKQRNSLFRDRESLIDKDVIRTDRTHEYFHGDNNIHLEVLHDVLMTYNMFNFDLGYVQGMNDLLSPILIVMENEVDAFWCFVGLMERMEQNFHMDQSHIKHQLGNLHTLLQFIDAELANYLAENNSSNMYFFFRWMLICFKREFSFEDVMYLWEVLWTDHLCQNFELLVCLAILISQKTVIMESKFGCNEILKHINDLSLKVQLEPLLKHAEGLYILLKQHDQSTPGLPPTISVIMFPNKNKNLKKLHKNNDHESDSDATSTISSVKSSRGTSPNPEGERKARTRNLTESHSIDENDSAVVSHTKKI